MVLESEDGSHTFWAAGETGSFYIEDFAVSFQRALKHDYEPVTEGR